MKLAENVRVVVRCRPMNTKETNQKCKNIVKIENCSVGLKNSNDELAPDKIFTFDNAYDSCSSTESLYNDICYSLVENVLEGYNGTIFAYGQTGCGKSHTMQGPELINNNQNNIKSQYGIISKSFDHIFEAISVANDIRYLALVSYLEIYNENIRDLLKPSSSSSSSNGNEQINLQLKELPGDGIFVQNLSTYTVHNVQECEELLRNGSKNRIVGSTLMNSGSSRSHSIFTISLEQIDAKLITKLDGCGIRKGKLNLVDLAGSERQNKTGASGERLKEATKINLSLSALGNVISALVDGKTKHIPYRDSKLTRLLQDSLGGNTKTLMIACISPADYNYDETLSTLRYASRAKNISNKPKINEDPKDAMLREYQNEIFKLKKMLETNILITNNSTGTPTTTDDDGNRNDSVTTPIPDNSWQLEDEHIKLKAEYEAETQILRREHEIQKKEREDLVKDMERLKTHYENQLKKLSLTDQQQNSNSINFNNLTANNNNNNNKKMIVNQQEAINRIEAIKNALIGGERANDVQLKEKRYKKKIAAQHRLSALAHALSRIEQSSDRNLLQDHYTDIQQELTFKNDAIKQYRQKIKALEREVSDLQSEFQLDRADYLESIRRLERNLKFYQQLLDKALPILRKDGKYWDPNEIQNESVWNDDLKKWKFPEGSMNRFKLPPAASAPTSQRLLIDADENNDEDIEYDSNDIAENYFLSNAKKNVADLIYQRKGFKNWKDLTLKNKNNELSSQSQISITNSINNQLNSRNLSSSWINVNNSTFKNNCNPVLASWLPQNHIPMNKTWYGLSLTQQQQQQQQINSGANRISTPTLLFSPKTPPSSLAIPTTMTIKSNPQTPTIKNTLVDNSSVDFGENYLQQPQPQQQPQQNNENNLSSGTTNTT